MQLQTITNKGRLLADRTIKSCTVVKFASDIGRAGGNGMAGTAMAVI